MASAFDSLLGNKTTTQKKKTGSAFDNLLKPQSQVAVAEKPRPLNPPSNSPFNPKNPANKEFNTQLDMRTNKTPLQKFGSALNDYGKAFKEVGKYAFGSESLPAQAIKMYTQPSEMVQQAESSIPNVPVLRETARAVLRTIIPMAEGFGTIVGGDILGQNELSSKVASNVKKPTQTVGGQTQSNTPSGLVTHRLTAEDVVNVALNSIQVGLLITPLVTKYVTKGTLNLAETFSKESKVPISYSDLQKITSSSSDAQAVARVGQEKFNAYREAANSNTVREALKQGYISLAEKQPTTFSNILKNAATRPVSEVANFNKTYGAKVETTTPTLLPEKATMLSRERGSFLSSQELKDYVPFKEGGQEGWLIKQLPEPPKLNTLPAGPNQNLLTAPKKGYIPSPIQGDGFSMSNKPNKQNIEIGKALNEYRSAVQNYNQKPTPTKLKTALTAKSNYESLRNPQSTVQPTNGLQVTTQEPQIIGTVKNGEVIPTVKAPIITQKVPAVEPIKAPVVQEIAPSEPVLPKQVNSVGVKDLTTQKQELLKKQDFSGTDEAIANNKKIYNQVDKLNKQIESTKIQEQLDSLNKEVATAKEEAIKAKEVKPVVKTEIPVVKESKSVITAKQRMIKLLEGKSQTEVKQLFKTIPGLQKMFPDGKLEIKAPQVAEKAPETVRTPSPEATSEPIKAPQTMPLDAPKSMPAKKVTGDSVSKIASSIEAKAVEQKLTQGFEGVAGYDKITIKDQSERATDLITSNLDQARAIIRGEQALPDGLNGVALITAMEEHIKLNPNAEMAYELANSNLVSETSVAGQTLRLAAERTPDSATAKLQEIKKAREAKAEKQISKEVQKTAKSIKTETQKVHLTKEELSWDKFLAEIQC